MEILKQAVEAYKQLRPAYEVPPINKVFKIDVSKYKGTIESAISQAENVFFGI